MTGTLFGARYEIPPATRPEFTPEWALVAHGIKDGQLQQCLICGGGSAPWRSKRLEIHHVVRCESGGTSDPGNLVGLCRQCHGFIHDVAERDVPFVSRVMLAMLLLGPDESTLLFRVFRLMFRLFVRRDRSPFQMIGYRLRPVFWQFSKAEKA